MAREPSSRNVTRTPHRGVAMDVTLPKADGTQLPMPTPFDDFTPKASPNYSCKADEKEKCENRNLLIQLMAQVGLKPINTEWWHFQLPNAGKYPLVEKLN